ncbi:MAG: pseudouridine-5'-phosphate glycosidase [Gemmatimonadota bacterium]|jgi:pseudouridine-5'-phosphate glycosidase|nr:pseudouridine-5'-phosphate glycosidase [Gemmatimonadota bacterium]
MKADAMEADPKALRISPEVEAALAGGYPVVALESTVLAHGLPRPRNLEVGRELEALVRAGGGVPATIAVIDGEPRIGLSEAELERIATSEDVRKLSTREIPIAVAGGLTGATTVAATSFLAAAAGITVFATGGIGGVHRGEPRDVSPDLTELTRTRILVVCAGAKAILDIPATREALETLAIPVLGWQTDVFPGFYSRETGERVDAPVESADEVAEVWRALRSTGIPGGLLLCAPVPLEEELPASEVKEAIDLAISTARTSGVRGKQLTPFLLRELTAATGGATLSANIALLRNNVRVATEVAVALAGPDQPERAQRSAREC